MTSHTPGPWKIIKKRSDDFDFAVHIHSELKNEQGYWRAAVVVEKQELSFKETNANAQLIASAPELLEELREVRWLIPNTLDGFKAVKRIEAVIAKAEGRK